MRILFPALCSLALVLYLACHATARAEIRIVAPESAQAQRIKEALSSQLAGTEALPSGSVDILVTIGASAHETALSAQHNHYFLPLFVCPYNKPSVANPRSFPLFSEPDPKLLVQQLDAWFEGARVGYLYAGDDPFSGALADAAADSGINLVSENVGARDVFGAINDLADQNISVFLVSKNPALYTNRNIRFVLEALYRKRIPVVATSESLLNAGAIATISTDDAAIVGDVVETIRLIAERPALTGEREPLEVPRFSTRISIKTNSAMEERFGVYLRQGSEL